MNRLKTYRDSFQKLIAIVGCILMIVAFSAKVNAQDASFSQYYASGLYLNPSLAGAASDLTFGSNYRSQWRSVVLPYVTSQMSIIYPLYRKDLDETHLGGLGFSVFNDRAGDGNFKTLGINGNFAYNLQLSSNQEHIVSMGIQAGIVQKNVDYTNLEWGEQYNPYIGFDATSVPSEAAFGSGVLYPDFSVGAIYYYNVAEEYHSKKMSGFLGASAYHLSQPNESFVEGLVSKLPMLIKVHGGVNYLVNRKFKLSPNVLFMMQNGATHMNGGLYATYRAFNAKKGLLKKTDVIAGAWYRHRDAFIISAGLHNRAYTIGLSYDYNTSSLRFASNGRGAWEISLALRRIKNRSPKSFATPRI